MYFYSFVWGGSDAPMKLRRRNSETLRAQYINNKEIRYNFVFVYFIYSSTI